MEEGRKDIQEVAQSGEQRSHGVFHVVCEL